MSSQEQVGGDHSTNIQGGEVTVIQGLTWSEVKEIVLDVFEANFYKLQLEAVETAKKRAEEITEKFLQKLKEQNEEGFKQAKDPDFQSTLYEVQKEYAKVGNEELGDLLVHLLVERTKQDKRTTFQIVLTESIKIASKITASQLAILSLVFVIKYLDAGGVNDFREFSRYLDEYILPLMGHFGNNTRKSSNYQHLEYCSCATIPPLIGFQLIPHYFLARYSGFFSKGFHFDELEKRTISMNGGSEFIIECFHDKKKIQFNALNEEKLRSLAVEKGFSGSDIHKLIVLNNEFLMSEDEIKECLIKSNPWIEKLFEIWDTPLLSQVTLTSVGMALGHAYLRKNCEEIADLSSWFD